jgi:hypothetical protein
MSATNAAGGGRHDRSLSGCEKSLSVADGLIAEKSWLIFVTLTGKVLATLSTEPGFMVCSTPATVSTKTLFLRIISRDRPTARGTEHRTAETKPLLGTGNKPLIDTVGDIPRTAENTVRRGGLSKAEIVYILLAPANGAVPC